MTKTPEMNADFARWYADAFMDEGEIRTRRWKGVVDTATAADYTTVEVLTRYAFATAAPANGGKNEALAEKHQALLTTISGNGSPLDPAESRRELQILSAAVLARLFSRLPDAPIAVLNASFGGMRTADLPMDLVGLAKKAVVEFSRKKHERPDPKEFVIGPSTIDFEVSPEALADMSSAQWKTGLDGLRDAARKALGEIIDSQNLVTKRLIRQISLGEEELQMLWWLIGAHSWIVDAPFTDVDAALKPLVFSKELGELTNISSGPASVTALLSRAGITGGVLKVSDSVNAADVNWSRDITKSTRISPVTTPLHFALEKRVEVGSDDAWLPVWASMTGLPADASMSAVQLAELFYREHLFLYVGN
ncbi:GTPase-associated system all-helical protein GASH [Pseudomonas sp. PAB10]|uniref:GTPase-associated system all-helical protein GASH n=1 Tax=Pseudomonas sp. PAB10 TaxID=3233047 RepID=UPI003F98A414